MCIYLCKTIEMFYLNLLTPSGKHFSESVWTSPHYEEHTFVLITSWASASDTKKGEELMYPNKATLVVVLLNRKSEYSCKSFEDKTFHLTFKL